MLVERARHDAGHDQEQTILSPESLRNAFDFLQRTFEENFMENAQLKSRICDMVERPAKLSRITKQSTRNDRRNAFKKWKMHLMGNVHFLHALMRNGIFQLRDQQDLATALLQEQSSVDEHHADDVAGAVESVANRETLRAEAVRARQQIKKAQKLDLKASTGAVLTRSERILRSEKAPEPTTPRRAQGYHCPSCFKCRKVDEEMPQGGLCTCPPHSQLQEGKFSSDDAQVVLGFRMGVRVVNDAKIREQLFYAVRNQAELIGSITYIDEKMSTSGLSGPLRDLFEGPLSELLSELKTHHEIISVLTQWAAQADLHIPTD
jgi:hypothetical protein